MHCFFSLHEGAEVGFNLFIYFWSEQYGLDFNLKSEEKYGVENCEPVELGSSRWYEAPNGVL